jgi:hypothetical protein
MYEESFDAILWAYFVRKWGKEMQNRKHVFVREK